MDTTKSIYKPPIHKHPLFYSARFIEGGCDACPGSETMYGSYYCNEIDCAGDSFFHIECVEAPLEINIPSHPQHPLLLTNDLETLDTLCDLCGEELLYHNYSCSPCEFNVHLLCGIKPSPLAIEHPMCHEHPLVFLKKRGGEYSQCEVCKEPIGGPYYSCPLCNDVYFHVDCVYFSKEVNHHCHSNHPLKLIASEALTDDAEKTCLLCKDQGGSLVYHCSMCNFTTCLHCTKNPPPLVVNENHKHPLTLFSRRISFTCDVCGEEGSEGPYVCLECGFVIHQTCIGLPHVININRHDHRISFTHHLGGGYSKCGVCRKDVSRYKGAYSCSVCPNYAVHSKCAVDRDVWDSVELERIPDESKYITSFEVVGDNLIRHFSHRKHILRLQKDNIVVRDEYTRCEACFYPVGFGSIYACVECCFHLHEKCANLPTKKRFIVSTLQYTLDVVISGTRERECEICGMITSGFKYENQEKDYVDVHCGSLSEPFVHDGHLHPLYFDVMHYPNCHVCNKVSHRHVLSCDVCDFDLCFYCASLPLKIWHRNDEHPLTLCYGIDASGENWCDMCEKGFNPSNWFYACYDCGVMLHTQCVVGDFSRIKLGNIFFYREVPYEAVTNNNSTRPLCRRCHSRCNASIILRINSGSHTSYICSQPCLLQFVY